MAVNTAVPGPGPRVRRRRGPSVLAAVGLVLALALVGAACGDDGDDAGGGDASVTVEDVWARTSPAAQANGAVYMVVTGGDVDDALVGVSVPPSVADRAELHETAQDDASTGEMGEGEMGTDGSATGEGAGTTTMAGGMMTMREVERIDVPAGTVVRLEPGGHHVMLLELAAPLEIGQEIPVTLTFAGAGTVAVTAEVREG
jgi:copper(I)-binding protein